MGKQASEGGSIDKTTVFPELSLLLVRLLGEGGG